MLSIIVNSSDSSRGSRPDRGAQNRASDQEEYMRNWKSTCAIGRVHAQLPSLGSHIKIEEQVWRLQSENKKLKAKIENTQTSKSQCCRCGRDNCPRGNKCPANGKQCQKC